MICSACRPRHAFPLVRTVIRGARRFESTNPHYRPPPPSPKSRWPVYVGYAAFGFGVAVIFQGRSLYIKYQEQQELKKLPPSPPIEEAVFEKPRRKPSSKEENRDIISSQHFQVKKSWEEPGVYIWGSNSGKVAAPDSKDKVVKTPRRLPFFDGVLLRDLKLDRASGAAIDERGDLLQWGSAFAEGVTTPTPTLRGKNLISLAMSRDRVITLGKDGSVYSVPISRESQARMAKEERNSWSSFWQNSTSTIGYRSLTPKGLSWNEKVSSIAGGLEHVLLLTSKGRVFSAVSGSQDFPSKGQLGIPGLTWSTRPPGAYDQPHEVSTINGFRIKQVAAGDYHSIALDRDGRMFTFGDNSYGQLGLDYSSESNMVDAPSLVPIQRLYANSSSAPKVTSVAAGGNNSYFTVDATRVASADEDGGTAARLSTVTADTWACGQGIWGTLGNGRWTHVQSLPIKIPMLSGLFEYDEARCVTIPIRLARISVGANHVAAVMDNVTYLDAKDASKKSASENDTNWGADTVFWGNNENYQLGNGRRNNVNSPIYIQSLYKKAENEFRPNEEHRFHITPKAKVKVGGRWVEMEQRIECGRGITAVYSGV